MDDMLVRPSNSGHDAQHDTGRYWELNPPNVQTLLHDHEQADDDPEQQPFSTSATTRLRKTVVRKDGDDDARCVFTLFTAVGARPRNVRSRPVSGRWYLLAFRNGPTDRHRSTA